MRRPIAASARWCIIETLAPAVSQAPRATELSTGTSMLKPRKLLKVALSKSARVVAVATVFGLAATAANANAEAKKLALVIGNGNYVKAEHLDNPVYDAHAIADKLAKLGFKVVEGYDVTEAKLRETIGDFADSLAQADVAVVYYAGHGVTYDGENYLLPTDIELKRVADLDLHALTVSSVLKQMSGYDRVNLVILDACRENPFPRELAKTTRAMPERDSRRSTPTGREAR